MTLGEVLQRRCGASSTWEEACAVLGAAAGLDHPLSEATLRMVSEHADPSFAAYFDRQRERSRAARGAAEPMPVDDPGDPYAEVDGMEEHP